MIQLQLDDRNVPGKITAHVGDADVQSGETTALAMSFDDHGSLLFKLS